MRPGTYIPGTEPAFLPERLAARAAEGGLSVKKTGKDRSGVKAVALGAGLSLGIYLGLLALISSLAVKGTVGESRISALIWGAAFAASLAGALTASRKGGGEPLHCAICGAVFWALLPALGFLATNTLSGARVASLAIPILCGAAIACLTDGKGKRKKRVRRPAKGHR